MEQTTKALLKPQQRLFVLRTNILPALLHQLVLAEYTEGYLDSLDLMVRSKVRLWLKLPHDTVTPFFYANYRDRGLGLEVYCSSCNEAQSVLKGNTVQRPNSQSNSDVRFVPD